MYVCVHLETSVFLLYRIWPEIKINTHAMLKGETALKQLFDGVKNDSIEECRAALADIDVNARKNGRTALHHAAMRCQVPMIEFLIEQGKYELLSKSGY